MLIYSRACLLCLLLWFNSGQGLAAELEDELRQRLRFDHATLLRAKTDFAQLRGDGKLDSAEEADYATWIKQMVEQLALDCIALTSITSTRLPDDLPCHNLSANGSTTAEIDFTAERTVAEKSNRFIEQLNGALGEFDEQLLQEQARIKAQTPPGEPMEGQSDGGLTGSDLARTAGDVGDSTDSSETSQHGKDQDKNQTKKSGDSDDKEVEGKSNPGTTNQGDKNAVPEDIPDGSDDDVVARQIREAAEKETDPALKKKLWEEYRRYKSGIE